MEHLRDSLLRLRLEPTESTWYSQLALALLVVILLSMLVIAWRRARQRRHQLGREFMDQAIAAGLSTDQGHFLLRVARRAMISNLTSLVNTISVFDRHLGALADRIGRSNPNDRRLDQINRIRVALGFDQVPADHPQRSTRQLAPGQSLMVWAEGGQQPGSTPFVVLARTEWSLIVAPLLRTDRELVDSLRRGSTLAVRFWREGDTEYGFVTRVLTVDPETVTVGIRHSDAVKRLQQRDFFRLPVHFPIAFYLLPEDEEVARGLEAWIEAGFPVSAEHPDEDRGDSLPELQQLPRVEGEVTNLSAGGLAVSVPEAVPIDRRLLVDPRFDGPFPLAGVHCQVVHLGPGSSGFALQVHFVDLPAQREREIVRGVYEHQIQSLYEPPARIAGPTGAGHPPAPASPDPEDQGDS
ncbi:MAG: PilZ domain-containing protein [Candidatus Latescibacterota bacterium]